MKSLIHYDIHINKTDQLWACLKPCIYTHLICHLHSDKRACPKPHCHTHKHKTAWPSEWLKSLFFCASGFQFES